MGELQFEHLFDLSIEVAGLTLIGQTFNGHRLIADVAGGTVEGPRLKGTVLNGASGDWIVVRKGGVSVLDVRITIESDDGALILMKYHGFRHGPREVLKRLDAGEAVDPSEYYMRIAPSFETGDERYYWMNNIVAVGMGEARATGPRYSVHRVL